MSILKLSNYTLHYGEQAIFDDMELVIHPGQRLCITGRNGTGKSTLLKCLLGAIEPDKGSRWIDSGAVLASLDQELPDADDTLVFDFVASGIGGLVDDLRRYNQLISANNANLDELEKVQQRIESADGWNLEANVKNILSRLELDGTQPMRALSGGWRRRAALARALATNPDVLLLDEPTNHLDIGAIDWLEQFLAGYSGALIFVTHDRMFLRKVATSIGELDRGVFTLWKGDYDGFLKHKEQVLMDEERHNALFDKKLAQEETWIRQGIKARRTRNEGRVRALKAMREERASRRERQKNAVFEHNMDGQSGKLVAELNNVDFGFDNKRIIRGFSTRIIRGDKIGLIGPNGVGKSTLLKLILGQLSPQSGSADLGTNLTVAYFDQLRAQLDMEKSAVDNVGGGRDSIEINGKSKHIISYLQDFLFSGERARTAIKSLSGGERNRILLAKLFSVPSNLLVLDEPTNDLDSETLDLLEELLMNYQGTLLLVTHDRAFLDNVVTSSFTFDGKGNVQEYIGGYTDWINQGGKWPDHKDPVKTSKDEAYEKSETENTSSDRVQTKTKKLSYKLQRELDEMPELLENLESELNVLRNTISEPEFYDQDAEKVKMTLDELAVKEKRLEEKYERWTELEALTHS